MRDVPRPKSFADRFAISPEMRRGSDTGSGEPPMETVAEQFFLRNHAAPFAVVDQSNRVLYLSQAMARFVRPVSGAPSSSIDEYLSSELRLPARSVLAKAADDEGKAAERDVLVKVDGETRIYDINARPLSPEKDQFLLVLETVRLQDAGALSERSEDRGSAEKELLERELLLTRQRLTTVQTEFDSTDQELRSSNEELLSMNEELQSSNEELETSREELQSINEELETINAELSENNQQLVEANSDLQNLFESTDVATIFLDFADVPAPVHAGSTGPFRRKKPRYRAADRGFVFPAGLSGTDQGLSAGLCRPEPHRAGT